MRRRSPFGAVGGGIFLLFLALAFFVGHGGILFLPILMVGLAISSLIGSFASLNPRRAYAGIQSFIWFIGLAFCFLFGFFPLILVVVAVSAILGALMRPLIAALMGMGFMTMASAFTSQPQQPYQQPYQPAQPYQPPYQQPEAPYQQGYQPPVTPQPASETYQEGGRPYQYPAAQPYDQPQSQYPQEMPPQ